MAESEAAAAVAVAAGRSVARRTQPVGSPLASLGSMVAKLLGPPRDDDDQATRAARELGETARQGNGAPGDCRVLHGLAVTALRQTASTPTGGFVSGKLSDLVERYAPRCGIEEAELAAAGALLVAALPDGTPAAGGVRSFYAALDAPAGMRGGQRPHLAPIGAHTLGQNLQGTPYRLVRKLGVGGMGIVFEAEHTDLNRRVAIKVLHGALNRDPQVLARFKQEARSAARIRHPHIVEIHDFGTTSAGEVFLVMELLSGQNLARLCRSGRLPLAQHGHPAPGLRGGRGRPPGRRHPPRPEARQHHGHAAYAADPPWRRRTWSRCWTSASPSCAIRRPARRHRFVGDLRRAAHRHHQAGPALRHARVHGARADPRRPTDHRVDIYSLGCIAYEVLTGDLPFPGDRLRQDAGLAPEGHAGAAHRAGARAAIPELDDVVLRAMSKDPDDRYTSMAEFADALGAVLEYLPAPGAGVMAWSR